MLHDLAHAFADAAGDAPPTSHIEAYVLAIIGAAGLVLAATLPVLLSRKARSRRTHPLNSDNLDDDDEDELRDLRKQVRVYEIFIWRRHFNPTLIRTGEEDPDAVSF